MHNDLQKTIETVGTVLLGKEHQVKLSLACLLSRGHLLIEDLPGMGKTTLAHALAMVLGLEYQRVQFTSDMLPADIIGASVFNQANGNFVFHKGPIFTQVLLADEINRSSPKTQSALLEAMEEQQVTTDGETRQLPDPFFVIATQNPVHQSGTYNLPESQLDRFLMRIELGYPDPAAERKLYQGQNPRDEVRNLPCVFEKTRLQAAQKAVDEIKMTDNLLDYIQRLVQYTRFEGRFPLGLSPRGAMALVKASKAWAFLSNREYVIPEDVQAVFPAVVTHRLPGASAGMGGRDSSVSATILDHVDVLG